MQGINLKPAQSVPLASTAAKPAMSNAVWRQKLEAQPSNTGVKILQHTGLITKEQYCDAIEIAESLNKTVEQVIYTSFLSPAQAELCTDAIHYVETGIISEQLACDAILFANTRNMSFAVSLKYHGFGW